MDLTGGPHVNVLGLSPLTCSAIPVEGVVGGSGTAAHRLASRAQGERQESGGHLGATPENTGMLGQTEATCSKDSWVALQLQAAQPLAQGKATKRGKGNEKQHVHTAMKAHGEKGHKRLKPRKPKQQPAHAPAQELVKAARQAGTRQPTKQGRRARGNSSQGGMGGTRRSAASREEEGLAPPLLLLEAVLPATAARRPQAQSTPGSSGGCPTRWRTLRTAGRDAEAGGGAGRREVGAAVAADAAEGGGAQAAGGGAAAPGAAAAAGERSVGGAEAAGGGAGAGGLPASGEPGGASAGGGAADCGKRGWRERVAVKRKLPAAKGMRRGTPAPAGVRASTAV